MMNKGKKCPNSRYCLFKKAFGYCIEEIGENCDFYEQKEREVESNDR